MKRILIFLSLFAVISCGSGQKDSEHKTEVKQPTRTAKVVAEPSIIRIAGTIRPAETAVVASRFGGFLRDVPIHAGKKVKKNQVIVVLDDRTLSAQGEKLAAMKVETEQSRIQAESMAAAAKSQKELAESTFRRIQKLYERKSASQQEYEEALARKDSAEAQYNAALEQIQQSKARLVQVESEQKSLAADRSYTQITAPFDGTIQSVKADPGSFVNPGQVIAVVERTQHLQVVFMAEQELLHRFNSGKKVNVDVDPAGEPLSAEIVEVSGSMDPASRTFSIKADLLNPSSNLKSGSAATVLVPMENEASLWLPEEFVVNRGGITTVNVRKGDDWTRIFVRTGRVREGKVEIVSGLNANEEVGLF